MAVRMARGVSSSFNVTIDKAVVAQAQTDITKSFQSQSPLLANNPPTANLVEASPTLTTSPAPKADGFDFTKTIATRGAPAITIDKAALEKVIADINKSLESPVAPSPVANDATIPAGTFFSQADVSVSSEPGRSSASVSLTSFSTGDGKASAFVSTFAISGDPKQGAKPAIGADITLTGAANGQTDEQVISFAQDGFASASFAPQISLSTVTPVVGNGVDGVTSVELAGLASQTAPVVEVI